ncbi:hypothetical protein L6164_036109 [Bauhinia variegata]|uniref:Uncharacterized protein n=1 Tax=Bauhinia variegata TaxID=167791 RepID=A0ACB9KFY4_BAUVA|nr:hypothetical protein L6164_036109 [Bauhinia variegata]
MGEIMPLLLLLLCNYLFLAKAATSNGDFIGLKALMDSWQNTPPNWVGSDPCDGWDGIKCSNSRVTSITLSSTGLTGELSGDVGSLSELETLDLSYNKDITGPLPQAIGNLKKLSTLILVGCGFNGPIPDEIGNLQELVYLSLNSNNFNGQIPASIGNLSKLYWLDLAENQLNGPIPVSNGSIPGLDKLLHAKHFHLGQNKLSGIIPQQLFSSEMALIHVLFEGNQLRGSIPSSLGLVTTLEVVRLDGNMLSASVPQNLNNLTKLHDLFLSNNKLSGSLPNLTGMSSLNYLDMSNNSFVPTDFPPWFLTLESLTTLVMENTQLQGQIPTSLFSLGYLQTLMLKGNKLNGTLDIGTADGNHLRRIDLESNLIGDFKQVGVSDVQVILKDNPICYETGEDKTYCSVLQPNSSYTTPPKNCLPSTCSSDQISSPNCECAYPYTGTFIFRSPSFSDLGNETYYVSLEESLMHSFQSHNLPVDSVSLSNATKNAVQYLELSLQVFPSNQDHFNRTGISSVGFVLSNQTFKPQPIFGPFYFDGEAYQHFGDNGHRESKKSRNIGIIIGAAVGGSVLLVLLLLAGVYAFCQKKRAEKALEQSNPFRRWDSRESHNSIPQLQGARVFSFEELQKSTKNFSQDNDVGSGGYGKVYRGKLPNGQLIAIKRAHIETMQGALQFKAEIELLSRVHHTNLVRLIGFCFDQGEQMLVYEYVPNGTLKDAISGKSGIRLDWVRRLKIALGAAKGLAYLHELANPPIIHRDIKTTNILLDERMNAKVADFGLSKPMVDTEKDHITTQVKGTMGYLDPEYYMSQQLTEKSDVYSFGVVMLELITAKKPLDRGKYIVIEIKNVIDQTKDLYGLHEIVDPVIGLGTNTKGFEKFVDIAMSCVQESGADRPSMSYVVREIENMLQQARSNTTFESPTTSSSYDDISKGSYRHPYITESPDLNAALPYPKIEPM